MSGKYKYQKPKKLPNRCSKVDLIVSKKRIKALDVAGFLEQKIKTIDLLWCFRDETCVHIYVQNQKLASVFIFDFGFAIINKVMLHELLLVITELEHFVAIHRTEEDVKVPYDELYQAFKGIALLEEFMDFDTAETQEMQKNSSGEENLTENIENVEHTQKKDSVAPKQTESWDDDDTYV